jgi:hypothetical protein
LAQVIYTSYPQLIHNLKTLEFVLFTGHLLRTNSQGRRGIEALVARGRQWRVNNQVVPKWPRSEAGR